MGDMRLAAVDHARRLVRRRRRLLSSEQKGSGCIQRVRSCHLSRRLDSPRSHGSTHIGKMRFAATVSHWSGVSCSLNCVYICRLTNEENKIAILFALKMLFLP